MSGKALNKQEMDSIDLAKFVFACRRRCGSNSL